MAKIKILFLSICVLAGLDRLNINSNNLAVLHERKIVEIAKSQIGIKEYTGSNDGKSVELYLKYTGLPKGNAWCAAFVSWVYAKAGFKEPKTAWSPSLFPKNRLSLTFRPASVYGLYSQKKRRIVHCGITIGKRDKWILGIEGNTNIDGSIDGDGVYYKRRHALTIRSVANWIAQKRP